MTEELQLNKMRLEILGDVSIATKDEVFKLKLEDAKNIALNALYPYDSTVVALPTRCQYWQARCAIELYRIMGEENIKAYSENGMDYTRGTGLVSNELMSELTPTAGVIL
jgi:hypothetical protein